MSEADNPYAPPGAHVEDVTPPSSQAEEIRREHIKRETSIRTVGLLYYLGGGLACAGGMSLIALSGGIQDRTAMVLGIVYVVLGVPLLFAAWGLRRLRPWARIVALVLSSIGLLGFPLGTLINGYILYLLLSKQGKRIFESDYPAIVAATPGVKYRTSAAAWIVLAIVILLFAGVLAAVLSGR